ncbi:MAG: hypothetical protein ACFFCS_11215 [Candidatus Hodarchaeota archaeon]
MPGSGETAPFVIGKFPSVVPKRRKDSVDSRKCVSLALLLYPLETGAAPPYALFLVFE